MSKKNNSVRSKIRTFDKATKNFLQKSKPKLKDSAYAQYISVCERHLIPYFEDIELNRLDGKLVNDFIQSKLKNGGKNGSPLSPKTVSDMINLFNQIIKPYHNLDFDVSKPSQGQTEISVLTDAEYNKLKTYLSIGTDYNKLGIITAMLTGARLGELCALRWGDIDLDNGFIRIDKTMQRIKITDNMPTLTRITDGSLIAGQTLNTLLTSPATSEAKLKNKTKIIIDTPKSNASIRTIPIPEVLLNILKKFQCPDNTYLLTGKWKYIEPRVYQRHFKAHLQACDIKDNKFHTIRHTFATMAISRGMDIKTLSVLLGHTDVGFTMKRYVHPNMEHRRKQIEKIAIGF